MTLDHAAKRDFPDMRSMSTTLLLAGALALAGGARAGEAPLFVPQWLGAQYTFVDQHQGRVHSPYAGPLSLHAQGDTERSHTFGAYFGVALPAHIAF